jgi:ABC-type glycerol-3-phosphate transport system substrate-binding protein
MEERVTESLWRIAEGSGMSRRKFLAMMALGGAATVLAGCSSKIPPSTTATSSTNSTTSPTTTPVRLVDEPTPIEFFIPIGGAMKKCDLT